MSGKRQRSFRGLLMGGLIMMRLMSLVEKEEQKKGKKGDPRAKDTRSTRTAKVERIPSAIGRQSNLSTI